MGDMSEHRPRTDVAHSWKAAVGLPWDPFDSCAIYTRRELVCPRCGVVVVTRQSARKLDLVARFSAFCVHSLPCPRGHRLGTKRVHMYLRCVSLHRHERESCGCQVRARSRKGSQEFPRCGSVRRCSLPSVSTFPSAICDLH